MATDATGTPSTNFTIPKYLTSADAPSGKGFNAAIDYIDTLLKKGFVILTTQGDIPYASAANVTSRLPIGSASQVLTVAGGVPTWATPAGGYPFASRTASVATAYNSGNTAVTNNTQTPVAIDTFVANTDGYSISSNQIVVPRAGYYRVVAQVAWAINATGLREVVIEKYNSSRVAQGAVGVQDAITQNYSGAYMNVSAIVSLAANESVGVVAYQNSGSTINALVLSAGTPAIFIEFLGS